MFTSLLHALHVTYRNLPKRNIYRLTTDPTPRYISRNSLRDRLFSQNVAQHLENSKYDKFCRFLDRHVIFVSPASLNPCFPSEGTIRIIGRKARSSVGSFKTNFLRAASKSGRIAGAHARFVRMHGITRSPAPDYISLATVYYL